MGAAAGGGGIGAGVDVGGGFGQLRQRDFFVGVESAQHVEQVVPVDVLFQRFFIGDFQQVFQFGVVADFGQTAQQGFVQQTEFFVFQQRSCFFAAEIGGVFFQQRVGLGDVDVEQVARLIGDAAAGQVEAQAVYLRLGGGHAFAREHLCAVRGVSAVCGNGEAVRQRPAGRVFQRGLQQRQPLAVNGPVVQIGFDGVDKRPRLFLRKCGGKGFAEAAKGGIRSIAQSEHAIAYRQAAEGAKAV